MGKCCLFDRLLQRPKNRKEPATSISTNRAEKERAPTQEIKRRGIDPNGERLNKTNRMCVWCAMCTFVHKMRSLTNHKSINTTHTVRRRLECEWAECILRLQHVFSRWVKSSYLASLTIRFAFEAFPLLTCLLTGRYHRGMVLKR